MSNRTIQHIKASRTQAKTYLDLANHIRDLMVNTDDSIRLDSLLDELNRYDALVKEFDEDADSLEEL